MCFDVYCDVFAAVCLNLFVTKTIETDASDLCV